MGYLDNRSITVEAILTKKGRQLLSQGRSLFNITKFALSDDEVDYHLWNAAHPSGSNYYGYAIEQLPVLEPTPDETQTMRYKLVSFSRSTSRLPVVTVNPTAITFIQGENVIITPGTIYAGGNNAGIASLNLNGTLGYTAILHNSDVAFLEVVDIPPVSSDARTLTDNFNTGLPIDADRVPELDADITPEIKPRPQPVPTPLPIQQFGAGTFLGDSDTSRSVFAVGMRFRLIAKQITGFANINTTLTMIGNETGGSAIVTITNRRVVLRESTT